MIDLLVRGVDICWIFLRNFWYFTSRRIQKFDNIRNIKRWLECLHKCSMHNLIISTSWIMTDIAFRVNTTKTKSNTSVATAITATYANQSSGVLFRFFGDSRGDAKKFPTLTEICQLFCLIIIQHVDLTQNNSKTMEFFSSSFANIKKNNLKRISTVISERKHASQLKIS